ncbi:hypothetical protein MCAP1_002210 [Malassezia caprae]|uniref:FIST domain-containing protein n=1 Tax=Malassezia caprae TaxID=1381934 RepID=A0AAF0EBH9_9BASI|nr:hypothetical protein MCAP1_002210 [Malassezia caprae]
MASLARVGVRRLCTRPERVNAECAVTFASCDADALVPAVFDRLRAWNDDHILLFALSKSLPRTALGQLVSHITASVPPHARVGMLAPALSPALVPDAPSKPVHAAALAAVPAENAVTFRSTIRGAPRIAVGRWTMQKDLWQMGTELRADGLDRTGEWTSLWGRENAEEHVPESLAALQADELDALLVCTDPRPEGLWEGLDARFPHAHLIGATAALTPFETGREHTMLGAGVYENGAVGLAWRRPTSHLARTLGGLVPLGPRLVVTGSARGNIVSSLNDHNAAQQFLHLVLQRRAAPREHLDAAQLRALSSNVRRDDDFFLGLYASETDSMPLLVARIQAGHPVRGTLGLDTETELEGLARYAQVFRTKPHDDVLTDTPRDAKSGVQYMWVTENAAPAHVPLLAAPAAAGGVWTWEHTFLASAESSWFARIPGTRTRACAVPQSSVVLCRS